MSFIEVTLVRHAQSQSNAEGIWQGHGDSALSDLGNRQVEDLSKTLGDQNFDLVLSSDLQRTQSTSRATGVDAELDAQWREINVGDWDGLTMEEVFKQFPDQLIALRDRKPIAVGGGESWQDVYDRASAALKKLVGRLQDGERAAVFTHGGVIASLLIGGLDAHGRWPWPLGRIRNTGINQLRFYKNHTELFTHNDIAHLQDTADDADAARTMVLATSDRATLNETRVSDVIETDSLPASIAESHKGKRVGWITNADNIAAFATESAAGSNPQMSFAPLPQQTLAWFECSEEHRVVQHYGTTRS